MTDAVSIAVGYIAGIRQRQLYELASLFYEQEQDMQKAFSDGLTDKPAEDTADSRKGL